MASIQSSGNNSAPKVRNLGGKGEDGCGVSSINEPNISYNNCVAAVVRGPNIRWKDHMISILWAILWALSAGNPNSSSGILISAIIMSVIYVNRLLDEKLNSIPYRINMTIKALCSYSACFFTGFLIFPENTVTYMLVMSITPACLSLFMSMRDRKTRKQNERRC